jgi:HlyD family secretion protein
MQMKTGRKRVLYAGALVALAAGGVYAFSGSKGARADFDPTALATVERGTMVKSVVATGKIEPITKVEIKSKANGIIEALRVDVGDIVSPGAVLVELDKQNLAAAVREKAANLQVAEAAHKGAEAALEKNVIEAEGPDVVFAQRAAARAQSLFDQHLIAQSGLDEAKSALEMAQNRQRTAKGQLIVARAKVTESAAGVAQARAAAEQAEESLRNATIRSPLTGIVLSRDVEIGSAVSSILNMGANGTLVMTLGNIQEVFVRGKVDEADIGRVRMNQTARITVETFKDRKFEGRVTQISPIGVEKDNVTTFEVKVSIKNPGSELRANMTANAEIVLEEHANSLIVPEAAIVYDPQKQTFVDLVAADAPQGRRRVPVKLGVGSGTRTQIISGVKEGDKLVLPK